MAGIGVDQRGFFQASSKRKAVGTVIDVGNVQHFETRRISWAHTLVSADEAASPF